MIDALTDDAFASVADIARYPLDGADRLQAHLRALTGRTNIVVPPSELEIVGLERDGRVRGGVGRHAAVEVASARCRRDAS